jgi:hypothetical protein
MVTDYGQTIDHDLDGCGDNYGYNFDPGYNPAADLDCPPTDSGGTLGIPLMGAYMTPWVYVWKDGVIKGFLVFNGGNPADAGTTCNSHWWKPFRISSGTTGTPTYTLLDECGNVPGIQPYAAFGFGGRMGVNTGK